MWHDHVIGQENSTPKFEARPGSYVEQLLHGSR